jgi:hypothetical protein
MVMLASEPGLADRLGPFSECLYWRHSADGAEVREAAGTRYANLLRDTIGPAFGVAPVSPAVLAWNDGAVSAIAGRIAAGQAFRDLPILADALEGAGCHDPEVLTHCRRTCEHARGCWVVDVLLGKHDPADPGADAGGGPGR